MPPAAASMPSPWVNAGNNANGNMKGTLPPSLISKHSFPRGNKSPPLWPKQPQQQQQQRWQPRQHRQRKEQEQLEGARERDKHGPDTQPTSNKGFGNLASTSETAVSNTGPVPRPHFANSDDVFAVDRLDKEKALDRNSRLPNPGDSVKGPSQQQKQEQEQQRSKTQQKQQQQQQQQQQQHSNYKQTRPPLPQSTLGNSQQQQQQQQQQSESPSNLPNPSAPDDSKLDAPSFVVSAEDQLHILSQLEGLQDDFSEQVHRRKQMIQ